jgi:hypothetical protein
LGSNEHLSPFILRRKLKERDARIGNLEDTVDALTGRIEAEITRGDKLSTQNATMKDLLDKQAKVHLPPLASTVPCWATPHTRFAVWAAQAMALSSEEEAKAALVAANARCYALETKLGGLLMEHRGAQRKMAKELDGRVRAMDTLRGGVEAELRSLTAANARLRAALKDACAAAASGGAALPVAAVAELSVDAELQLPEGDQRKARASRSPSPFRRFTGKRAVSPGRAAPVEPAPAQDRTRGVPSPSRAPATGHATIAPSAAIPPPPLPPPPSAASAGAPASAAASKAPVPMTFRRWTEQGSAQPLGGSMPPSPAPREGGATTNVEVKESDGDRLLLASREASKEAAAQKHAARLKAVRASSRGKWGFSV